MTTNARVRWGILGTGSINRRFLAKAHQAEHAEIAAASSRSMARAEAFATRHEIPRAYGSYEALLADTSIDVVYVSLPNALHHEWTMRSLAAGKHVLCEKPYSRDPVEVTTAFDAAAAAGLFLMEGFMWRHTPQARRLLQLLPEIGQIETIRSAHSFRLEDPSNVRLRPELDGGSLMDVGCYCVNGARLLAGAEPEKVFGQQVVGPTGVDLRFAGLLRFPRGQLATIVSGLGSEHATLEAIGTHGSLRLAAPWHGQTSSIWLDDREFPVETADPYLLELEDFSAAVRGEKEPLLGRADSLGQARAIAALYESAATGREVSLTS